MRRLVTCSLCVVLTGTAAFLSAKVSIAADWPQWLGANRDGVWRETDLVDTFPRGGPKVLWRIPLGTGYSGPAVVGDRVYFMDRQEIKDEKGQPLKVAGKGYAGTERVLCLNAADGKIIWQREYDCPYRIAYPTGPRTTPLVHQGRVYTLGAMGDLLCLDAADGKVRWSKSLDAHYKPKLPVWGWAGHPLLDGDLLYCLVGGEGSAVVALNKDDGSEVWKALSTEEIGYSPPMIYQVGGKRQLIIWLSEALYGLDPAAGKLLWKHDYPEGIPPQRPAVNIITVKLVSDMFFLSTYYHGPMMLKLDGASPGGTAVVWKGKSNNPGRPDGPHCVMASPVFKDGYGYAVGNEGDLHCFRVQTGEKLWQTYAAVTGKKADCGTVFLTPLGDSDRYVLLNDQGDLLLAELTPKGYKEIDRAHILEPAENTRGRDVVWSHPAFARRCVFARNEKEMVCVSLAKDR